MPTSPRRNAFIFTEILGEFDSTQWADVGIGPYAYNSNFGVVNISLFIQVHNKKKQPPILHDSGYFFVTISGSCPFAGSTSLCLKYKPDA